MRQDIYTSQQSPNLLFRGLLPPSAAGFVLNLLYGICGSIGMILAGLGGFAAFLALLLCPFVAPMLLSLAGSALIVAASALFAWLF